MAEKVTVHFEGKDGVTPVANGVSKALAGIAKQATAVAAGFGLYNISSRAVSGLSDAIVGFNARMEQSEIAWGTMLKSGTAAKTMMQDLQRFAALTPFEFPQLESASRRLMAMGFSAKEIIPIMTDLGNAASALGMGTEGVNRLTLAIGQMRAKSKVSGEEMRQLAEAGVPAWQILADAIGKPISQTMKLSEAGKITADTFITAFRKFSEVNWGGMMDRQSKTFLGAMSTIKDSITLAAGTAFKPLFQRISELSRRISEFVQSDQFAEWADRVGAALEKGLSSAEGALKDFGHQWTTMSDEAKAQIIGVAVLLTASGPLHKGIMASVAGLKILYQAFMLMPGFAKKAVLGAVLAFGLLNEPIANLAGQIANLMEGLAKGVEFMRGFGSQATGLREAASRLRNFSDEIRLSEGAMGKLADIAGDVVGPAFGKLTQTAGDFTLEAVRKAYEDVTAGVDQWRQQGKSTLAQFDQEAMAASRLKRQLDNVDGYTDSTTAADRLNKTILSLTNDLMAAQQASDVYGKDSQQLHAILQRMGPTVSVLKTAFADLDEGQKDAVASAIKGYNAIFASLEKASDSAVAKDYSEALKLLRGQMTALKNATDQYGVSSEQAQSIIANITVGLNELRAQYPELSAVQQQEVDNMVASFDKLIGKQQEVTLNTGLLVSAMVALHPATAAAALGVQAWQSRIADVNLALVANQDQIKAAQQGLRGMQEHLGSLNARLSESKQRFSDLMGALNSQLSAAKQRFSDLLGTLNSQLSESKQRLSDLMSPRLAGMGAFDKQITALQDSLRKLEIQRVSIQMKGGDTAKIDAQIQALQNKLRLTELTREDTFAVPLRKLKAAAEGVKPELAFGAALNAIKGTKQEIFDLTDLLGQQDATTQGAKRSIAEMALALSSAKQEIFDLTALLAQQDATTQGAKRSIDEMALALSSTKQEIASLTGEILSQEGAIRGQENAITAMQQASEALNKTLQGYQAQLQLAEQNQQLLTAALAKAFEWVLKDREEMEKLGPAGVEQASIVDEATRTLLQRFSEFASGTRDSVFGTLAGIVAAYEDTLRRAQIIAANFPGLPSYGAAVPTVPEIGGASGGWFNVPGFAKGGAFAVGGLPGVDSVGVAFRARPGEVVSITPPGRGGATIVNQFYIQDNTFLSGDERAAEELARRLKPKLDSLVRL